MTFFTFPCINQRLLLAFSQFGLSYFPFHVYSFLIDPFPPAYKAHIYPFSNINVRPEVY